MGYDFHITRKEFWSDEDGPSISIDEWISYANSDIDIQPDPENAGNENWIVVIGSESWPLWWSNCGEIYTKNPDELFIKKLVAIAKSLNAKLLGDNDEIYFFDPAGAVIEERR